MPQKLEKIMNVDVKVTIKNATSCDITGLFRSALDGHLEEQASTNEGRNKLQKMINDELNRVANQAFELGRKYQQDA